MKRKVSLVMPTFNGMGTIERSVESIFNKTLYSNYELIIVDDGSKYKTREWVKDYIKKNKIKNIKYLKFEKNKGVCSALNAGYGNVGTSDVIRIDNDIIIKSGDWIDKFIKAAYLEKKTGIVSAKPVFDNGLVHSYEIKIITDGYVPYPCWEADPNLYKGIKEIESNILCCAYIKNIIIKECINDENYNPCWVEDIDYCINARSKGYNIQIENSISVIHTRKNRDRKKFEGKNLLIKKNIHKDNLNYFQKKWWNFKKYKFILNKYKNCPEITKFIKK